VTVPIDTNPFLFHWVREEQGYEWVQGVDSKLRLVARVGAAARRGKLVRHAPLLDDRLFEKFADLKPTRVNIQRFADRYGNLFDRYGAATAVRRRPGRYRISQLHGPSFRKWKSEIQRMRTLVGIWRAIKTGRKRDLERVIIWQGTDTVGYKLEWSDAFIATPRSNPHLLQRFKAPDVVRPAMYLLQAEINNRIANPSSESFLSIIPRLVWCPGPRIEGVVKPDHHQRLIFEPTNLLAAIWLQFARAVTEGYQLQTCAGCGEYFQVGKGARRSHTKTCSAKCRKRVSRKNRDESW
jgi:hypothetical protein